MLASPDLPVMKEEPIHFVAVGASTAVGRNAWAAAAAVRGGISGFAQHPYMIDSAGEPMRAAIAPWLDIEAEGFARFELLLFPALDEAMRLLIERSLEAPRLSLWLGLPSERPGLPENLAGHCEVAIRERYAGICGTVHLFPQGHAAGLLALSAASDSLRSGASDACVVAAADSYLDPLALEWLEANEQLHGAGRLNNAWGFVPGEGAGALLLLLESRAERYGIKPLARLLGVGSDLELNRIKTQSVCTGQGLTQAFRQALLSLPEDAKVSDIFCDMNGEPYRADEFGFATVRTSECFVDTSRFVAPADCWGDVGAASGPLLVLLSVVAADKRYLDGPIALAWASSEGGERSAALVVSPAWP